MPHLLDRPIWSALATRHAEFALGNEVARRYPASIAPFVSSRDEGAASLDALAELVRPDESVIILQVDDVLLPAELAAVSTAAGVQMLLARPPDRVSDDRVQRLTTADAAEMLALAELTRPGPFSLRALSLGNFWGVKRDGRLVAMAGERMKQPGYTELSGVCSHPQLQGQGLGRLLSSFVTAEILARGDKPYLHAYATNTVAIELYKSIGFEIRTYVNVAVVRRAMPAHHGVPTS
jgi:predicted GNAT family acetyltransferase